MTNRVPPFTTSEKRTQLKSDILNSTQFDQFDVPLITLIAGEHQDWHSINPKLKLFPLSNHPDHPKACFHGVENTRSQSAMRLSVRLLHRSFWLLEKQLVGGRPYKPSRFFHFIDVAAFIALNWPPSSDIDNAQSHHLSLQPLGRSRRLLRSLSRACETRPIDTTSFTAGLSCFCVVTFETSAPCFRNRPQHRSTAGVRRSPTSRTEVKKTSARALGDA